jgi:hypothetical protein
MIKARLMLIALFLFASDVWAGKSCQHVLPSATASEAAAAASVALKSALEARGTDLAIVARRGQDLSAQGLIYSHAAIAQKRNGQWRVVHLLNECGTDSGALFEEGLFEFFSDSPISYQSKIVWLNDAVSADISQALSQHQGKAVFEPRYSIIARVGSKTRQNSTAWLLEMIVASHFPARDSRKEARFALEESQYQADQIHLSYGKRFAGGLFKANAIFTDHPLSTRLSGNYPVSTVRSVFRYFRQQNWVVAEQIIAGESKSELVGD